MSNKLGPYISSLMATVLDKEADEFVKDLAWGELKRLNVNIEEFLHKHQKDDVEESKETIKTLLQEDKKDGKK
tara:strand:+ start:445 stop:663 length:219 start_codon:yes stop_codon:yes gene_type:complete